MISMTYQSKVEQVGIFKRVLKMRLNRWNTVVLLKNMSSRSVLQMFVLKALGQATRGKGIPPPLVASAFMVSLGFVLNF
jgi:hypothetical protein